MHGVKRSRVTPQAAEAKRLKDQAKIEAYTTLQNEVMEMKKAKVYTPEALKRTTDLLDLNPEYYTIWNYRRHILMDGLLPESSPEDIVALLATDIRLTTAYLQVHPKVYWIWNHRKWCLENVPLGPGSDELAEGSSSGVISGAKDGREGWRNEFWKTELRMLEAMLDADARNFHAWGYRRYVIRSVPETFAPKRTVQDELRYTQKKIESNFSNFSAWHLRTKLLGGLWEDLSQEDVNQAKDKEFELVTQALWTDPNDQSGWIYHRWLIGASPPEAVLRREIKNIRELHEMEPDSKCNIIIFDPSLSAPCEADLSGCMNALAHYCGMLAKSGTVSADEEEKERHRSEAQGLYERLQTVDPDRKGRYADMTQRTLVPS